MVEIGKIQHERVHRTAGMAVSGFLLSWLLLVPLCRIDGSEPLWRRALGGKIDSYAAQGPGGDVYVVADDRALHSIDPLTGESRWIYRPGGRLRNLLLVSPDGTIYVQTDRQELYAVTPGGTGRWRLQMNAEAAALPAAAPDGRLILPLVGGRIVCASRRGALLWTRDEDAEASAAPVVRDDGVVWMPLSDGRVIALNRWGEQVGRWEGGRAAAQLVLDGLGRIWSGGFGGHVALFDPDKGVLISEIRPNSSRVAAILTEMDGTARVFFADGVMLRCDAQGREVDRSRVAVSGGFPSASADGTLYAPASDGSIRVLLPDGEETSPLRGNSVLAEPLLTDEGVLIAGGGDWILYAWAALESGPGWRQFRGGPRRSGALPSEKPPIDRKTARQDAGFFYREKMALSGSFDEQLALLEEMESYSANLTRRLPWANLLLEDLASVGTSRRIGLTQVPTHALVRERAYTLLAADEDFRSRGILLHCLRQEDDTRALAAGFRALGRLGTDWDGASMRLIAERLRDFAADEQLVMESARAMADLIRYNGDVSDTAGYDVMNQLLAAPLPPEMRDELMDLIRSVSGIE